VYPCRTELQPPARHQSPSELRALLLHVVFKGKMGSITLHRRLPERHQRRIPPPSGPQVILLGCRAAAVVTAGVRWPETGDMERRSAGGRPRSLRTPRSWRIRRRRICQSRLRTVGALDRWRFSRARRVDLSAGFIRWMHACVIHVRAPADCNPAPCASTFAPT
jgi:hypothetical protein